MVAVVYEQKEASTRAARHQRHARFKKSWQIHNNINNSCNTYDTIPHGTALVSRRFYTYVWDCSINEYTPSFFFRLGSSLRADLAMLLAGRDKNTKGSLLAV